MSDTISNSNDFENIRPLRDNELQDAFDTLLKDADFLQILRQAMPALTPEILRKRLANIHTVQQMQQEMMLPLLHQQIAKHTAGFDYDGYRDFSTQPSLIISNHRDIVMDPAFLNYQILCQGQCSTEIAIGDNLIATAWIGTLMRINRCFIVYRNSNPVQQGRNFSKLSRYIRHIVTEKRQSVWIAQREGRAKDSNDTTQESILKMFAMGDNNSMAASLQQLHIVPATISYEFDPCDYLKAQELQVRRDHNGAYTKQPGEDNTSMITGICGNKGHVHVSFAECINPELQRIAQLNLPKNKQAEQIKQLIDQRIHNGYAIYPINRVAFDLLLGTHRYTDADTPSERQQALDYLESRVQKATPPQRDEAFLRRTLLQMYANPLINQLKAHNNYTHQKNLI